MLVLCERKNAEGHLVKRVVFYEKGDEVPQGVGVVPEPPCFVLEQLEEGDNDAAYRSLRPARCVKLLPNQVPFIRRAFSEVLGVGE